MKKLLFSIAGMICTLILQSQTIKEYQKAGELLMNQGENAKALVELNKAIELDQSESQHAIIYAYAGICAQSVNDNSSAKGFYKQAILRGFEEDLVYLKLAEICTNENDYECAAFAYSKAMIAFPNQEMQFGKKLAGAYFKNKQFAQLEQLSVQLLASAPNDLQLLQFHASSLQGQQKMKAAKLAFDRLYEAEPDNLAANIFLGNHYYQSGKVRIEHETKKYTAIKTPDRIQWTNYQKALKIIMDDTYGKAIPYLTASMSQKNDPNIKKMLHAIYSKMGDKDKAAMYAPQQQ